MLEPTAVSALVEAAHTAVQGSPTGLHHLQIVHCKHGLVCRRHRISRARYHTTSSLAAVAVGQSAEYGRLHQCLHADPRGHWLPAAARHSWEYCYLRVVLR